MAAEQDPRLGRIGGIDTKECAVSGTEAHSGMTRFSLGNDWYFRVKASRVNQVDSAFIAKMRALIPAEKTVKKAEAKTE